MKNNISIKKLFAGVLALLMVVTALPVNGLYGALTAKATFVSDDGATLTVSDNSVTIYVGQVKDITISGTADATTPLSNEDIIVKTDDATIASIANGTGLGTIGADGKATLSGASGIVKITGEKAGTAKITVETNSDSTATGYKIKTVSVTVLDTAEAVDQIVLSQDTNSSVDKNGVGTMVVTPGNDSADARIVANVYGKGAALTDITDSSTKFTLNLTYGNLVAIKSTTVKKSDNSTYEIAAGKAYDGSKSYITIQPVIAVSGASATGTPKQGVDALQIALDGSAASPVTAKIIVAESNTVTYNLAGGAFLNGSGGVTTGAAYPSTESDNLYPSTTLNAAGTGVDHYAGEFIDTKKVLLVQDAEPVKAGQTFLGWKLTASDSSKVNGEDNTDYMNGTAYVQPGDVITDIENNITLTAVYAAGQYEIIYKPGTDGMNAPAAQTNDKSGYKETDTVALKTAKNLKNSDAEMVLYGWGIVNNGTKPVADQGESVLISDLLTALTKAGIEAKDTDNNGLKEINLYPVWNKLVVTEEEDIKLGDTTAQVTVADLGITDLMNTSLSSGTDYDVTFTNAEYGVYHVSSTTTLVPGRYVVEVTGKETRAGYYTEVEKNLYIDLKTAPTVANTAGVNVALKSPTGLTAGQYAYTGEVAPVEINTITFGGGNIKDMVRTSLSAGTEGIEVDTYTNGLRISAAKGCEDFVKNSKTVDFEVVKAKIVVIAPVQNPFKLSYVKENEGFTDDDFVVVGTAAGSQTAANATALETPVALSDFDLTVDNTKNAVVAGTGAALNGTIPNAEGKYTVGFKSVTTAQNSNNVDLSTSISSTTATVSVYETQKTITSDNVKIYGGGSSGTATGTLELPYNGKTMTVTRLSGVDATEGINKVTYEGKTLTMAKPANNPHDGSADYYITLDSDAKTVGDYKATLHFIGAYTGTQKFTYTITPISIEGAQLLIDKDAASVEPITTDNTSSITATTANRVAKRNLETVYTGKLPEITLAGIVDTVSGNTSKLVPDEDTNLPDLSGIKFLAKKHGESDDKYSEETFASMKDAGAYDLMVTFAEGSNYTGKTVATFADVADTAAAPATLVIKKQTPSTNWVVTINNQKYTGNYITPAISDIVVYDKETKTIVPSSDWEIPASGLSNNKEVGTAKIVIRGKSANTDGSEVEASFEITKEGKEEEPEKKGNIISIDEDEETAVVRNDYTGETEEVELSTVEEGIVYRLYSGGEHVFTKSEAERDWLLEKGWVEEKNDEFSVISAEEEDAVPVYRLYNPNEGNHHYTTNAAEVAFDVEKGWKYEKIAFYVYDKSSSEGTPQVRLYNPGSSNGEHQWTSNAAEIKFLEDAGWKNEGVAWNVK